MVIKSGAKYHHGEVKRDPRIPWQDQVEALAEDYIGFDWTSVHCGVIRFVYLEKRSDSE